MQQHNDTIHTTAKNCTVCNEKFKRLALVLAKQKKSASGGLTGLAINKDTYAVKSDIPIFLCCGQHEENLRILI